MSAEMPTEEHGAGPARCFDAALHGVNGLIASTTNRSMHLRLTAIRAELIAGIAHLGSAGPETAQDARSQ